MIFDLLFCGLDFDYALAPFFTSIRPRQVVPVTAPVARGPGLVESDHTIFGLLLDVSSPNGKGAPSACETLRGDGLPIAVRAPD